MLKIKALKKKKKGKKGKHKEEELFDSAELEQYRQKLEAREAEGAGGETSSAEQSDEWQRFKALTAGVDSVLKKTQDDLDRIKTTSYFQKKSPKPDKEEKKETVEKPKAKSKKWIGFEEGVVEDTEEADQAEADKQEVVVPDTVPTEVQHFSEEEEEEASDKDEDIFDTSYVDVVASGEVKLAYIPDSPVEEDDGFDPFDTSIVETVIKDDPKKSKLVSLGCAVDVLTGKVEKPSCVDLEVNKRRRPKKQDLLLGSFDEGDVLETVSVGVKEEVPVKTILDEEPDTTVNEIDLTINLATILPVPTPVIEISKAEDSDKENIRNINSEFELDDDLDDEFAALAAECLLKSTVVVEQFQLDNPEDNNVKVLTSTNDYTDVSEFNDHEEFDPFDTSFASNVLPGKCELKIIEEEILLQNHEFKQTNIPSILENISSINIKINDSTFNEHNFLEEDQIPLSYKHRDLLGGSTTDLSKIGHSPIEPAATKEQEDEISYVDPFDTSVVDVLVAPGKAELKFLEKELLDEGVSDNIHGVDNDDDFDPRADSSQTFSKPAVVRPAQLPVGEKRLSIPKVVAFNIDSLKAEQDLLATGEEEEEGLKITKPLTPYYADSKDIVPSFESDKSFTDPFDTSFVTHNPGKVELKLIESELVGNDLGLKRSLSDEEFNPRADVKVEPNTSTNPLHTSVVKPLNLPVTSVYSEPDKLRPDILSEEAIITTKLHTPVLPRKIEEDINDFGYSDPFDTSVVDTLVAPGKAELKLIESELIHSAEPVATIKRSYTDQDFDPRNKPEETLPAKVSTPTSYIDHTTEEELAEKPLTPQSLGTEDDIDPFDTSCVDNLLPGKVELKLLESELIHN